MSRRGMQFILGVIWLLDGILQLQPRMFSSQVINDMVLPMAQGQPSWIAHSIMGVASLIRGHEWLYNIGFASVQLVIGFWLMVNFRVKTALSLSFVWALIVWWFGEGFGQLATGQALLITGAPGAVLLYAVIGCIIWPSKNPDDIIPLRRMIARYSLGLLWIIGAVLQFQPAYRHSDTLSQIFVVGWASQAVGHLSSGAGAALALVQLATGLMILLIQRTYVAAFVSAVISFIFWWVGQGFGELFNGMATDPNAGPLMILLALCTQMGTEKHSNFTTKESRN